MAALIPEGGKGVAAGRTGFQGHVYLSQKLIELRGRLAHSRRRGGEIETVLGEFFPNESSPGSV